MTPEDHVVCLCSRQNFEKSHQQAVVDLCQRQPIRWEMVYATANLHQVSPLVYHNLSRIPAKDLKIPPTVLNRFIKTQIRNIFVKKKTRAILEMVLDFFFQKGIDVMLVKGEAFNWSIYDKPWYTISLDVDLVIRLKEDELTEKDHREIIEFLDGINDQRDEFKEHIEFDFYAHHDMTMNNILTVDWERIWAEAEKIRINSCDVFVMTPEEMLLAAAINSCRKRFFRLKSVCDMATIIEKYPNLDWGLIARKAEAYKCNTILYTALIVASVIVDCRLPEGVATHLKVHPIRASLIRYLVNRFSQRLPLSSLFVRSKNATLKRTLCWPLFLTYATYRVDLLAPKVGELYAAWRNPPPEVSEKEARIPT